MPSDPSQVISSYNFRTSLVDVEHSTDPTCLGAAGAALRLRVWVPIPRLRQGGCGGKSTSRELENVVLYDILELSVVSLLRDHVPA